MKLGKLIFGLLLTIGFTTSAQDDPEKECLRMRFLAGEELKIENYKGAATYYLQGEIICGGYDAANYARMIGSLRNAMNATLEKEGKTAYADTIEAAYKRAEAAGAYDQADDLFRGSNILQTSKPDRATADKLFKRGITAAGTSVNEAYLSYYYYNLYAMWSEAPEAEKPALKKRMISEFFELSTLIGKANMTVKTQETIKTYFDYVVRNCDDILPDLKEYLKNLPSNIETKKATVMDFISLLEAKECTSAPEYAQLIDTLVEIDPTSIVAQKMKIKILVLHKKYSEAISAYRKVKELTNIESEKQEFQYEIARLQFEQGSYTAAYNTAMSVSGEHKGNALIIAGKSVGNNASNCGSSTFERNCNYIYAVQILQQGRALGASDGGAIGSYTSRFPTSEDCFKEGNPASVTLSCYGVTVTPCN